MLYCIKTKLNKLFYPHWKTLNQELEEYKNERSEEKANKKSKKKS